ncbi:unnamed protein product [Oncorhynchus mykiss]|uniref:Peptidase S8 pro-domain domain-containing protein n=1 Tax=Oncorhynchus mykiss TaxID=8022 RepID=A0A060W7J9_ONCMY|nr:unnamed protein product [Oncorhynchus mykiss]
MPKSLLYDFGYLDINGGLYGTNQSFIVDLGFLGVHADEDHQRSLLYLAAVREASAVTGEHSDFSTPERQTAGVPLPSAPVLLFMDARLALLQLGTLLVLLSAALESTAKLTAGEEVYTNTWAVHIEGGPQEADRIARKHGFINHGNAKWLKCIKNYWKDLENIREAHQVGYRHSLQFS